MHQLKSILLFACLLCYTSAQAIWLSVDPLADKYPYISPYAYCNWNPVKYVDPETGNTYHSYDVIFMDKPDDKLNQYDKNARHEASLNYNCGL